MMINKPPGPKHIHGLIFAVMASLSLVAQSQVLDLETTFKGNQEQPKVLYILPWQKIAGPQANYQPLQSLINESFSLLDRDEFRQTMRNIRQSQAILASTPTVDGSSID